MESGIAQQLRLVLGALGRIEILGGDRGQGDPVLQPLDVGIMLRGDLGANGREVDFGGERGVGEYGQAKQSGGGGGAHGGVPCGATGRL